MLSYYECFGQPLNWKLVPTVWPSPDCKPNWSSGRSSTPSVF